MTISTAQIANTQTFGSWLQLTNRLSQIITENTVTCDSSANGSLSTGNSFVNGAFGAIHLVANTIGGGNVQISNTLYITTNVTFQQNLVLGTTTMISANGAAGTNGQVLQSNGTTLYWVSGPATMAATAYANAISISANADTIASGTLNTARLPATANITTAVNVGANVNLTTSKVFVGNSTVNATVNATAMTVGANTRMNANGFLVGNSTVNSAITQGEIYVGAHNSSVTPTGNVVIANGQIVISRPASTEFEGQQLYLKGFRAGILFEDLSPGSEAIQLTVNDSRMRWTALPLSYGNTDGTGARKFADLIYANNADGTHYGQFVLGDMDSITRNGLLTLGRTNSTTEGGQMSLTKALDNSTAWVMDVSGNTADPDLRWFGANGTLQFMYLDGVTGNLYTRGGSYLTISDASAKKDITDVEDSLNKVMALRGVNFKRKDGDERREIGVIAQDVQAVAPELVITIPAEKQRRGSRRCANGQIIEDTTEYKDLLTVNYQGLIPILIEAIKELSAKVDRLEQRGR